MSEMSGEQLLALFVANGAEMEVASAGIMDHDGTVTEIPPDPDGVVRVRWNLRSREQLNPDFMGPTWTS